MALKHRFGEVNQTVTGGFRTNQAAAEGEAFTGEYAGAVVGELTHHPGHKAHFTPAYADITGRHVGIRAEVAIQFGHQRLAETHHFAIAFAFRIEVAAAFTAAHWQGGQSVFEGLFKTEEFQNRQVYGGVETHTALIRADGGVELHAPGAVNLNLIAVINPNDAELDSTLRFNQTFQQIHLTIARIFLKKWPQGGHHLADCLSKFSLIWIALLNAGEKTFQSARLIHRYKFPLWLWLRLFIMIRPLKKPIFRLYHRKSLVKQGKIVQKAKFIIRRCS